MAFPEKRLDSIEADGARVPWAAWGLALILFVFSAYRVRHSVSGDASIYFTYFKNFFDLPFSYQPGTVSHGASSPLHVVLFAMIFHLFGDSWLGAAKIINFGMIFAGLILLERSTRLNHSMVPLLAAFVASFGTLMAVTAELFETGLVFFTISSLYYLVRKERILPVILVAGLLHLVRPELILVTFALYLWMLWRFRNPRHLMWMTGMGLVVFSYYLYMAWQGAGWLPSSVVGRAIRAIEDPMTWSQRFTATLGVLGGPLDTPYWIGFAGFLAFVLAGGRSGKWPRPEMLIGLPVIILYFAVPPGVYVQRYLVPVLPILTVILIGWVQAGLARLPERTRAFPCDGWKSGLRAALSAFAGLVLIQYFAPWNHGFYRVTQEEILLPDLAETLNPITEPLDNVLLYEIQGQYHLKARAIGITVIGGQALDFLLGRESLEELLQRERIHYIVTMNSFNYRRVYDGTRLEDLYAHDLHHAVGASFSRNGWTYTKIASNPDFSDQDRYQEQVLEPMNVDDRLRLFGRNSHRAGTHFLWNSIYKVENVGGRMEPETQPAA